MEKRGHRDDIEHLSTAGALIRLLPLEVGITDSLEVSSTQVHLRASHGVFGPIFLESQALFQGKTLRNVVERDPKSP